MSNREPRPPLLDCDHGAPQAADAIQQIEPRELDLHLVPIGTLAA